MANLNDIAAIADSLEKPSVAIGQECCVRVRNRNASCNICVEGCKAGALAIADNQVSCSASACVNCGLCVATCPVEAFSPLNPSEPLLMDQVRKAQEANGGAVVLACGRAAAKRQGDPERYAEVPCLGRIHDSLLLTCAEEGAQSLTLVDGHCDSCKFGWCNDSIQETVRETNGFLESVDSALRVSRVSEFPEEMRLERGAGSFGSTRRGFFSEAMSMAKESALAAAQATLNERLGEPAQPELGQRLRVTDHGTLPQFAMARHGAVLDALDRMGPPETPEIQSRLFGAVTIQGDRCNGCGMCATFCPTGALRSIAESGKGQPLKALEFLACDCVQCGLCVDVCWKDCLSLSSQVSTAQLFDFEPVTFLIGPQKPA